MREHKIIVDTEESSKFSQEFYEKEKKRAITTLLSADNFILVTHDKAGGGGAISCINGDHMLPMAFAVNKMSEELRETIKTLMLKGVRNGKDKDE